MKKNIVTIFSIILILLFRMQLTFAYCKSNDNYCENNDFSLYISIIKSSFNKKYDVIIQGDKIPREKYKLLYEQLLSYIKNLEKKNNQKKMNILVLYDEKQDKFSISLIEKIKENLNTKYV